MYNRAEIVDQNFVRLVSEGRLPAPIAESIKPNALGLSPPEVMDLFESQLMSRHLDLFARVLKNQGLCYYTIGSSGHEGNVVIGKAFPYTDLAFLHYRSGALMIQRSKQLPGTTPIYDLLLSFVASSEDPIAGGRHKRSLAAKSYSYLPNQYHRLPFTQSRGSGPFHQESPRFRTPRETKR